MEREPLQRARTRLGEARDGSTDRAALEAAVERARTALESLAERTAELEAVVPERLGSAVRESMRVEVLPVGRHVAEVRGLANQTIRRLERIELAVDAERRARVDDLAILVDLVASGWHSVDQRLNRLERAVERVERALQERPAAEIFRLEDRQERSA